MAECAQQSSTCLIPKRAVFLIDCYSGDWISDETDVSKLIKDLSMIPRLQFDSIEIFLCCGDNIASIEKYMPSFFYNNVLIVHAEQFLTPDYIQSISDHAIVLISPTTKYSTLLPLEKYKYYVYANSEYPKSGRIPSYRWNNGLIPEIKLNKKVKNDSCVVLIDFENVKIPIMHCDDFINGIYNHARKLELNIRIIYSFMNTQLRSKYAEKFRKNKIITIHAVNHRKNTGDVCLIQGLKCLKENESIIIYSSDKDFSNELINLHRKGHDVHVVYDWFIASRLFSSNAHWSSSTELFDFPELSKLKDKYNKRQSERYSDLQLNDNSILSPHGAVLQKYRQPKKTAQYKTKPCEYFQDGNCKYSDEICPFLHICSLCGQTGHSKYYCHTQLQ